MTSRLKFRNIDTDPSEPVEDWPDEGVQAALERGSITDYRRLAAAIRRDPWGPTTRRIEAVLGYTQPYGSAALMTDAIARAREAAITAAKEEVARLMRAALTTSNLSQAAFAGRLGTSASRMSTYLRGDVTPSASLLVRAQQLASRCLKQSGS